MKLFQHPDKKDWKQIIQRPIANPFELESKVQAIIDTVKENGDAALYKFAEQFDKVQLSRLQVTASEIEQAVSKTQPDIKEAIELAIQNIQTFHSSQKMVEPRVETMPGVTCYRKSVGIEKVGLYIPGGTAPLFSTLLMLAIPAQIAGCKQLVVCTPSNQQGEVNEVILYIAQRLGLNEVYKIGGVQAIAAMAFGTETIPAVDKIFGPGNQYVTCAKQLVNRFGIAIDMPAGPSEVAIFADDTCIPSFVAADLLSQAEHGIDSQVLLVTTNSTLAQLIIDQVYQQLQNLSRKEIATISIQNSVALVVQDELEAMELLNLYAPEHLILATNHAVQLAELVINAGSVFLGNFAPESVGDYASGTNHTLPTNGYANAYSGVSVDSFVKKITFQQLNPQGLSAIGPAVQTMALAEGLDAHEQAVTVRLNYINNLSKKS
jgi:histidinol dehydrogenase